ncbi:MAG: hypothetical protein WC491_03625 [Candidatus Omnitrophota bacterium]
MKTKTIAISICIAIGFVAIALFSFMYGCRFALRHSSQNHLGQEIVISKALRDGKMDIALKNSEHLICVDSATLQTIEEPAWIITAIPEAINPGPAKEARLEAAEYAKAYKSETNQKTLRILQESHIKDKIK